jgi:hypothetical protein
MISLFRNKKGVLVIYLFFAVVFFLIVWGVVLAPMISDWGSRSVVDNSLTGVEAFFLDNLNLVIFLALILVIIVVVYAGGTG